MLQMFVRIYLIPPWIGKERSSCKGVAKIEMGCSWSSRVALKDQGVLDLDDGCKIIFSGASKQGQAGVGFLLSDTTYRSIISSDPFSGRIISIRCRGQGPNITIFQVYAPTTSYSDDQVEDFYVTLQSKIDAVPKQDIIIIMGD